MKPSELHSTSSKHNWEIRCMNGIICVMILYIRKWSSHKTDDIAYLRILQSDMKENIKTERDRQLRLLRGKRK